MEKTEEKRTMNSPLPGYSLNHKGEKVCDERIEFLQVRYFADYSQAYEETVGFIHNYNTERIHGSLSRLLGKFVLNI